MTAPVQKGVWSVSMLLHCAPAADLLAEVENLALRLYYMESAKNDVRSDIAVMKRAAEKAEMEVAKSEMEKQKQVGYCDLV